MDASNYTIYQNHPLDSYINVSVHYVAISDDGTSMTPSTESTSNATLYHVADATSEKNWLVCELHLPNVNVHGTFTVYDVATAYNVPTKKMFMEHLQSFIASAKATSAAFNI